MTIVTLDDITPSIRNHPDTALCCTALSLAAERKGYKVLAMVSDNGRIYLGMRGRNGSDISVHRVGSIFMERGELYGELSRVCRVCLKEIAAW